MGFRITAKTLAECCITDACDCEYCKRHSSTFFHLTFPHLA